MWPNVTQVQRIREAVNEEISANVCEEEQREGFSVVASPYRVCFLGAHVDHQGGAVTAMALDRGVLLGFVPSSGAEIEVRSAQFSGKVRFSIPQMTGAPPDQLLQRFRQETGGTAADPECRWDDYVRGACYALISRGHRLSRGLVGFVDGCTGMHGCGVSSSAAVGVAFLLALESVNGIELSAEENVELDRVIENEFLGLRNGVLDPSAILYSRRGCLTVVDCSQGRSGRHQLVPLSSSCRDLYKIMLAFSGLRHALTSKPGFNLRVFECEEAAKVLLKAVGRERMQPVLGNVSVEEYVVHKNKLEAGLAKRAQHFFTEKSRVEAGVTAWAAGDLQAVGRLMTESGRSSIENYECGCEELIQLWEICVEAPGVLGARFSGAGFRGCCVAIVRAECVDEASEFVSRKYRDCQPELWKKNADSAAVLVCDSGDSARVFELSESNLV